MSLFDILRFEEGFSEVPYYCSEGYPTIGIGTRIGAKGAPLEQYCFRVKRAAAIELMLQNTDSNRGRLNHLDWFKNLNLARQNIIESMAYQMGISGVFKFRKMIAALEKGDYEEASKQALDSLWARQTPERAKRHAEVLHLGTISSIY